MPDCDLSDLLESKESPLDHQKPEKQQQNQGLSKEQLLDREEEEDANEILLQEWLEANEPA